MDDAPRTLEHPLPPGMRDLLPEEARQRRALSRVVMEQFELHGYRVVTPPAFELASVVERGLGTLAASDLLRFVEPESGEVAVLRPDMTPQIARIVATRLHDKTPPFRLAYEGTVVRRRSGRAKKHRQIPQVGVELCGVAGPEAELELLALAASTLEAAGLRDFTIDLADSGIVRELLADVPTARVGPVTDALANKDEALVRERAADLAVGDRLARLVRLHGDAARGREVLVEAIALVAGTRAEAAARRLLALFDAASARGLASRLTVDPSEVRAFAYYTGTIFALYAEGPGDALGRGGRYDELLGRFGAPMPAVGLGIDLDALAWALAARAPSSRERKGVVVVGAEGDPRVAALRARGIAAVAVADVTVARAYAEAWGFASVWEDAAQAIDAIVGAFNQATNQSGA